MSMILLHVRFFVSFFDYIMLVYKRQHPSFFFLFCIIFCICFVYYSQFTPVFPQVLLFLLLYTSGYSPADFPCFIFLRRVPRVLSSGRTFYRNPPEFRLLSCTVFHPAPRNSVPVFSRSYVYICKVHVPGSGKIDCNLFHWALY